MGEPDEYGAGPPPGEDGPSAPDGFFPPDDGFDDGFGPPGAQPGGWAPPFRGRGGFMRGGPRGGPPPRGFPMRGRGGKVYLVFFQHFLK